LSFSDIHTKEQHLVELLRKQDQQALNLLYDKYGQALFGVIYRIVKNKQIAEEVLQTTFFKIWDKGADYDPQKGRLFTWILNIARNTAIDNTRSKFYKEALKSESLDIDKIDQGISNEIKIDLIGLNDFTKHLKKEQKQVIDLVYFHGYSHTEAARELNIPLGTVKSKVRASIKLLRKLMLSE